MNKQPPFYKWELLLLLWVAYFLNQGDRQIYNAVLPLIKADLRGARADGAADWCFRNGNQVGCPGDKPRRSFDLREQRLFDQLDDEERRVLQKLSSQPRQ